MFIIYFLRLQAVGRCRLSEQLALGDSNQLEPPKEWPKIYYKLGAVYKGRPPKSRNFKPPPHLVRVCPNFQNHTPPRTSASGFFNFYTFFNFYNYYQGVNCPESIVRECKVPHPVEYF